MKPYSIHCQRNIVFPAIVVLLIACTAPRGLAQQTSQRGNPRVPATIEGFESADLYAKVGGYLKSISVDLGDVVKEGQALAVIHIPEIEKQLAQKRSQHELAKAESLQAVALVDEAKSRLDALTAAVTEAETMRTQKQALYDFEKSNFERISKLASSGAIQTELLDAAQYKLKAAEAEQMSVTAKVATATANLSGGKAAVRSAAADADAATAQVSVAQANIDYVAQLVDYATIRAPWDGKITLRLFDVGAYIQSAQGNSGAQPILKLVRDDKVRVAFSLSQNDINGLKKGLTVSLSDISSLPGEMFSGTVSRFSAQLDPKTRMMRVEMDLDNADGKLKPGFFGYATVHYSK